MFLKKVFQYNMWLFSGMLVFIILQLVCYYKQGMVFSPWYNYGMYSGKFYPQKKYEVYTVSYKYGPGTRFFFPYHDDKIFLALTQFQRQPQNNLFFDQSVKRIFNKININPSPIHFTTQVSEAEFKHWFNQYADCWIYPSGNSINDYTATAIWDGNRLQLADGLAGGAH